MGPPAGPHGAIREGVTETGRVITAAAAVMVAVFASFIFGGARVIALFGVGLASAVFLDALVIRCILLPAVLDLFGERLVLPPSGSTAACRGSRSSTAARRLRRGLPSKRPGRPKLT